MPAFTMNDGFLSSNPVTNLHYSDQPYNIYQAFGSLTKIEGSHTLKFGGEHRVMDFSNLSWSGFDGLLHVRQRLVREGGQLDFQFAGAGRKHGAIPAGAADQRRLHDQRPSKNDSLYEVLFVQDDWHARPNLTFNIGLRWEYNAPTTERWNRLSNGFNASAANGITTQANAAYAIAVSHDFGEEPVALSQYQRHRRPDLRGCGPPYADHDLEEGVQPQIRRKLVAGCVEG